MTTHCCTPLLYLTPRGLVPRGEEASDQGGGEGTRTPNPLLAKQVRCQLRHAPGTPGSEPGGTSLDRVGHLGPQGLLGTVGLHLAPCHRAGRGDEHEGQQLLHDCLRIAGTTRRRQTGRSPPIRQPSATADAVPRCAGSAASTSRSRPPRRAGPAARTPGRGRRPAGPRAPTSTSRAARSPC